MISHEEKENEIAPNLHIICEKIRFIIREKIAMSGLQMFDYYVCTFLTTRLDCFILTMAKAQTTGK